MAKPTSSGKPFETCELRIEHEGGDVGEILIRTPSAMTGYFGISNDNTIDFNGWIHSGDLGRIDNEGYLHVTGRSKDIIIRGGENISAAVVEEVLHQHPAVAEAVVLGLPHAELGEEVGAVVVMQAGSRVTETDLAKFLTDRLAYFQVPSKWLFRSEPLPTNAVGKVLKPEVRRYWESRAAGQTR
jgi:acyl-CoA synthetase (AMP-forming)/AMP-acid ligase II